MKPLEALIRAFFITCISNRIQKGMGRVQDHDYDISWTNNLTERGRSGESKFSHDDSTRKFVYTLTT
jgi:hypothetical protein